MSDNATVPRVPTLTLEEHAVLFEEAIQLKMVPYDFRVWSQYHFDKCDASQITLMVNLFWDLMYTHGVKALEIGGWCSTGRLYDHATKKTTQTPTRNLLTYITTDLSGPPNSCPYIGTDSDLPKKWLQQSRHCFASAQCQVRGSAPERYYYFMLGVLAWEIKPAKSWACDPQYNNFDGYYVLGYDVVGVRIATGPELFKYYKAAFAQYRGVSTISFKLFTDGHTARKRILEQLHGDQGDTFLEAYKSLSSAIASFFDDTAPEKRNESVWILKHALSECKTWDDFCKYPQIGEVAQKYGFNDVVPQLDHKNVFKNLREVYTLVLDQGPIHLQRASNVQEHIRKVCQDNGMDLLPQTERILDDIDHKNKVLADTRELERSIAST